MTKILGHLRSNAVAYLALFVALGGPDTPRSGFRPGVWAIAS